MVFGLSSTEHTLCLVFSRCFDGLGISGLVFMCTALLFPFSRSTHIRINESGILLENWRKRSVLGNRELQMTLLDLAVVCLTSHLSKESFLTVTISSSKAHAENAQAHMKGGRAEAWSGGMTVEPGQVGIAVYHLRSPEGSWDQGVRERVQMSCYSKTWRESLSLGCTVWHKVFQGHLSQLKPIAGLCRNSSVVSALTCME